MRCALLGGPPETSSGEAGPRLDDPRASGVEAGREAGPGAAGGWAGPGAAGSWAGSEPQLVERIRDEILASAGQRITFARFMERALTEPGLGYYVTSEVRPTRLGDYLSAPELHPFFGRCVGRFLTAAWQRAGCPEAFTVHEHGAGRGTLRDSVRAGLDLDASELAGVLSWQALDVPGRGAARSERAADVVLANEYLDALPVHRVVQDGELHEAYVGWLDGWFGEVIDGPSTPALAQHLEADGVTLAEGQRAEIGLAAELWMRRVAGEAGLVIVIDYGHEARQLYGPQRMSGTLLTYREHRLGDAPFAAVGRTDISAHVDVTAIDRAARAAGLSRLGSTDQARFLAGLGLGELLADLGRSRGTELDAYLVARAAVARLLDPRHLGGFRVLAWGHDVDAGRPASLPGFGSGS